MNGPPTSITAVIWFVFVAGIVVGFLISSVLYLISRYGS